MSSRSEHNIQFIDGFNASAEERRNARRQARSHSARETHARARRVRIVNYQSQNTVQDGRDCLAWDKNLGTRNQPDATGRATRSFDRDPGWVRPTMPSPVSLLAADHRDPFASFAKPFTTIDHFLFDYYVRVVVPYMDKHCEIIHGASRYKSAMMMDWVRLSLADVGFLYSTLLSSCRHLCMIQQQERKFTSLAIEYKLMSLRNLSAAILAGPTSLSKSTVGNAMALAADEIVLGDAVTSRSHILGAVKMVELMGGPRSVGLDAILRLILLAFLRHNGLFDANAGPDDEFVAMLESN